MNVEENLSSVFVTSYKIVQSERELREHLFELGVRRKSGISIIQNRINIRTYIKKI